MSNKKGSLSALAVILLVSACGGGTDAKPPKYPYPEPMSVEDSELGVYLEDEENDEEDELENEDAE